jgi:acyl carrier protein
MLPAVYVVLDALPLDANGKVARRLLPTPQPWRPSLDTPYVPPGTPLETILTTLWADVLQLDRVGIHDRFFDLGGDSLLATQLMTRVLHTLHISLPLRSLLETTTVADMASVLLKYQTDTADQHELARLVADVEAIAEAQAQSPSPDTASS